MEVFSKLAAWAYRVADAMQQSVLVLPGLRRLMLRLMGITMGDGLQLVHQVHVGSNKVSFGNHVGANVGCFFDGTGQVEIGDDVKFGPFVRILTSDRDTDVGSVNRMGKTLRGGPVRIGRGCWFGMGASVMPNTTIGEGCVIGAGALVSGDLPPHGVYLGNPARRVRNLPIPE